FKCGTYWAGNYDKDIPAHGSTILLLDPETGFPQVLVSASFLNGFRTAAANAVAVSFLARSDASVLGVIGAGHQAEQEIRAVAEVRALTLIKISTRSEARASWIAERLQDLDIEIEFTSAENAVRGSDIVTTVTPSEEPLVRDEWVAEGTHISAMGADDVGKHELDTATLKRARLFADNPQQSIVIGEFQHAYKEGLLKSADEICAIGSVTLGKSPGRNSDSEITVFDSSGIAIQDLMAAAAMFEAAQEMNQVQYVDF
ncbi:MAG: ornithine cyclodeaminase/alanine dehydrogenase-like protein (mu-crystallin family), partial [Woeseiaceae bacterium]